MTLTLPEHVRAAMLQRLTGGPRQWTLREVCETTDHRTLWTRALQLIDDAVTRCINTPDGRLILAMPPQEGKSTTVSINLPIKVLIDDPETRIVTGSYAQSLANRNGRAVRNHIKSHPELGLAIAQDNGAAAEWTLEGHRGGLLAVGRGAGVTGRPADLLIIDDPIKDRAEADSKTIRETCKDWWTDALAARLAPGASVIVVATRWHEDDLSGWLAAQGGWEVLNIPAQCEDASADPLGRLPGEYMESARGRTVKQWETRKREAGPRTWAALYQGHPSPADGDIFKRHWWQWWTETPSLSGRIIQSWDLTFKGDDARTKRRDGDLDYVVGQVWVKHDADCYLLDQVRGRWGFTETVAQIHALHARWPQTSATLIEDKANGPAVIDSLRHHIPGVVPVTPQGGKQSRAAAVEPFVAAGNVHLPAGATWARELVEEAAAFPNATHDDQVDALTQALTYLQVTDRHENFFYGF